MEIVEDSQICPYCNVEIPILNLESHINSHDSFQNDEDYAKYLAAQEEQILSETAALKLVENDLQKRDKFDSKSPLSSVITSPEQLALALKNSEEREKEKEKEKGKEKEGEREKERERDRGPTAREFDVNFLSFVDTSHRRSERAEKEAEDISQVVLFDIDNCGGEFEQIADAFILMPKILVYVVGGPNLPNVSNVKLPTFAEMHQTKRLHIIPMLKKGKNAADFVLSFYGGVLHERLPLKIPFVIVSADKGLLQLVEHLGLLGRAAKLISNDIVRHLSVKPIILHPTFPTNTNTNTNTNKNTNTTTTTSTTTSTSNTENTDVDNNNNDKNNENKKINKNQLDLGGNPFATNVAEFSLEHAVWFVMSALSKTETEQRPKTKTKLENVVGSMLKRIPGKKPDSLSPPSVIQGLLSQNFIFIDGSKVMYLF